MAKLPGYECARKRKLLDAYVDEELSSAEYQDLTEHLRNCDACRQEVRSISSLVNSLQGLPRPSLPEEFLSRNFPDNISKVPLLCSRHKVVPRHNNPGYLFVSPLRLWGCSAAALILSIGCVAELRIAKETVHILTAPLTFADLISKLYCSGYQSTCNLNVPKLCNTTGSNYRQAETQIATLEITPTVSEQSSSITTALGLNSSEDGLYAIKM